MAVAVKYSAQVFSGSATWSGGSGTWGSAANWSDASGIHAVPGEFSGFMATDLAAFPAAAGRTAVTLQNSDQPSLLTLTLAGSTATAGYTLTASGTGGRLVLDGGAVGASILVASGSQTISDPADAGQQRHDQPGLGQHAERCGQHRPKRRELFAGALRLRQYDAQRYEHLPGRHDR